MAKGNFRSREEAENAMIGGSGGRRAGRGGRRLLEMRIMKTARFAEALRDGLLILPKIKPGSGIHSLRTWARSVDHGSLPKVDFKPPTHH